MLRDKHKDYAYFEKRLNRLQKRLREDVEMTDEISEKYLLFHYQDLVLDNEELVKLSYSIGLRKRRFFPIIKVFCLISKLLFRRESLFIVQLMSLP